MRNFLRASPRIVMREMTVRFPLSRSLGLPLDDIQRPTHRAGTVMTSRPSLTSLVPTARSGRSEIHAIPRRLVMLIGGIRACLPSLRLRLGAGADHTRSLG